jgi:hypothetical protein
MGTSVWDIARNNASYLADDELDRHAHVSIDNKHECRQCFCCACLAERRERIRRRTFYPKSAAEARAKTKGASLDDLRHWHRIYSLKDGDAARSALRVISEVLHGK